MKDARLRRCSSAYANIVDHIAGFWRIPFGASPGVILVDVAISSAKDRHFTAVNMFLLDPVDQAIEWPQNSQLTLRGG